MLSDVMSHTPNCFRPRYAPTLENEIFGIENIHCNIVTSSERKFTAEIIWGREGGECQAV